MKALLDSDATQSVFVVIVMATTLVMHTPCLSLIILHFTQKMEQNQYQMTKTIHTTTPSHQSCMVGTTLGLNPLASATPVIAVMPHSSRGRERGRESSRNVSLKNLEKLGKLLGVSHLTRER